ncbi:hypothetical protein IWQ60_001669 [Tieghemiomyces parasiticus]|uniref:Aminopeptidase P N-terminal domain-containing protein n=1 Tax=Tieghemiomyces parasiticus TaxID=78921 RepID=A0A9W8AKS5_9FUNG|nr:hypothetical protein IWQ60_001669 [Tieghemiomyces parasiticus]
MSNYPAKSHCHKVVKNLGVSEGLIYLRGFDIQLKGRADTELPFFQDTNFYYLTGADEPGLEYIYNIAQDHGVLYVPKMPEDEVIWVGEQESLSELKAKYPVDDVQYTHAIANQLTQSATVAIYTLDNVDLKSLGDHHARVNEVKLLPAIEEARMFKTPEEVEVMRRANQISSRAHAELMKYVRLGINERELYAKFAFECATQGGLHQAYGGIVGRGTNASILHYTKNSADCDRKSDVVLVDAGCEYQGYASDITRVFPVGKQFTPEARDIYSIVLDMQKTVLKNIAPGVEWEDMHRLATKVCAEGLLRLGVLHGKIDDILKHHVAAVFFPHGLGHSIGLDVHDVAGYPKGVQRIDEPGIRNLRMRRTLQPGMVVTVEPGCYFVKPLLELAFADPQQAQYIDRAVVDKYMNVGGVRIEDSVLVTETGHDNLTTVPKEIEEVEALRQ